MKKKLFALSVLILLIGLCVTGVYYLKNMSRTGLASGTFTRTIIVDGKKVRITIKKPNKNDPNIVPVRGEIKTKGDIALEKKDLETLANLIPSEYKK